MIIHADELIKSKLRERFARAGLAQKTSSYKFLNELRETASIYIKRSNVILVNHIINSLSDQSLGKSVALNLEAVLGSEDLMLKATFAELRAKVSAYFRKWMKKPPKPKKKIQVLYDTAKDDLTTKEWKNIDDIVYFYIKDEQNPAATEMLMQAYRMGIQGGQMSIEGVKEGNQAAFDYEKMSEWQESHNLAESLQEGGLSQDWAYAATWAKDRAAEHLAIYKDGERKGKAYETLTAMFREQIRAGLENEEDAGQLRSRLIFPERWTNVEGHLKHLSEELTPEEISRYSVAHLNRDWDRFAFNEVQSAFNNGRLVRWSKFDVAYARFARVRNKGKMCAFCAANEDTIVRVFASQSDFEGSEFYGGGDTVIGDERAGVAVWPGKSNVDRPFHSWWICAPSHPNCNHDYLLVG